MARTKYPKRNKAKVDRLRAQCERVLNTPWPQVAVPEKEWEPMRARYLRTRQLRVPAKRGS